MECSYTQTSQVWCAQNNLAHEALIYVKFMGTIQTATSVLSLCACSRGKGRWQQKRRVLRLQGLLKIVRLLLSPLQIMQSAPSRLQLPLRSSKKL